MCNPASAITDGKFIKLSYNIESCMV